MPLKVYKDLISLYEFFCAQLHINTKFQRNSLESYLCVFLLFFLFSPNKGLSQYLSSKNEINEITIKSIYKNMGSNLNWNSNYINDEEIQDLGGLNLHEVISERSNINVHSFSNQSKSSQLNIRGSGATSPSTILILFDGMKLNTNDLGGTDLSIINLDNIKSIEIIRGSSNVRYGGGASQGIINITSKDIGNFNSSFLKIERGNNELKNEFIKSSYVKNNKKFHVYGKKTSNNGDRDHNNYESTNLNVDYHQNINSYTELKLNNRIHQDYYQYPGPLSGNQYRDNNDSRNHGSILAGQEGRLKDKANQIQIKTLFFKNFNFENNTYLREYKNTYIFGDSILNTSNDSHDLIDQYSLSNESLINWGSITRNYYMSLGLKFDNQEYYRTSGGNGIVNSQRHNGDLSSIASFLNIEIKPHHGIEFSIGYRLTKSQINYKKYILTPNESSTECITQTIENISWNENCPLIYIENESKNNTWANEALEFKNFLEFNKDISLATSIAKTFRLPNNDELSLSNQDLKPQKSERYETNIHINRWPMSYDLNLFYYKTDNEILYQGFLNDGLNFNSTSPIKRNGGELILNFKPKSNLNIIADLGYTNTKYLNKSLPLTPSLSGSLNFNWKMNRDFNLKVNINYTGEQFDGNDFSNSQYPIIDSVTLVNTTISRKIKTSDKNLLFSYITIKNMFNKNYVSIAYSDTIYPGPLRTIIGGIKIEI